MPTDINAGRRRGRLAVVMVLAIACSAWGKVIYVDDDANAPGDGSSWETAYRFLQDALADAESAEKPVKVRVAQGVYKPDRDSANPHGTGKVGKPIQFLLVDDVALLGGYAGLSGADPNARDFNAYRTILSGDLLGNDAPITDPALLMQDPTRTDNSLVIRIRADRVRLEGCMITAGYGGGVWVFRSLSGTASDVIISDCVFHGNSELYYTDVPMGAAVNATAKGRVILTRCSFTANAGRLGAVYASDAVVDNCRFTRNYGWQQGGAGRLYHSTLTDCVFTDNRAKSDGGALHLTSYLGHANRVVGCVFRQNSAGRTGGAVVCDGESDVRNCVFIENEAATTGGAGAAWGPDRVVLGNCVLAGNRAGESGGAWFRGQRTLLEMAHCTASGNRAPEGGFLMVDCEREKASAYTFISNCIVSTRDDTIWSNGSPVELRYSCVGEGAVEDSNDWLTWGPGNVQADPCFVDLGSWDPNGTLDDPNDDFFVEGDYHLKSQAGRCDPISENWIKDDVTSPCIDAGDPMSPIGQEPFPNGGRINMGAYGGTAEASKSYFGEPVCETVIAGDINGDCRVDWQDLALIAAHWLQAGVETHE